MSAPTAYQSQRSRIRRSISCAALPRWLWAFLSSGQLRKGLAQWGMNMTGSNPNPGARGSSVICPTTRPNGDQRLGICGVAHCNQGADHGGAPVGFALQPAPAGRAHCSRRPSVAKLGGVVGGVHTGLPTKRIHAQASIVGQRMASRCVRGVARLGQGIFNEGLNGSSASPMPRSAWRTKFKPSGANMACISSSLPGIVGSQYEFHQEINASRISVQLLI
jgi:hypothetical protein